MPAKLAESESEQAGGVLHDVELPAEIDQALQGMLERSRGSHARRSETGDDVVSQIPAQASDARARGRCNGGAASVEGQNDCLLTPEELRALLGDE